jgi:membrane protein YdbS with pleckstrin-like domain
MALVSCPECHGPVSTSAASCPRCGLPLTVARPVAAAISAAIPARSASEEVLWEGNPSLKMLMVDAIRTGLFAVAVIVGVVIAYRPVLLFLSRQSDQFAAWVAAYSSGFQLAATLFVSMVVGLRLGRLGWRGLSLRYHHYRVSSQRVTIETGVIAKTLVEVDMRTVDDITFHQGVSERLLKLGRIDIISSEPGGAGQKTRLALVGIPDPRAVRELIRGAAYQATSNQLFTRST